MYNPDILKNVNQVWKGMTKGHEEMRNYADVTVMWMSKK